MFIGSDFEDNKITSNSEISRPGEFFIIVIITEPDGVRIKKENAEV